MVPNVVRGDGAEHVGRRPFDDLVDLELDGATLYR
jgi:hypothetical protein